MRFFTGDHLDSPHEATNYLITICANLKSNTNFDEQQLAIESICYEAHNEGFSNTEEDVAQMKKDIDFVNEGPDPSKLSNLYILAALSDVHHLFVAAKAGKRTRCESTPGSSQGKHFGEFLKRFGDHKIADIQSIDKAKLNACIKKIEYYLAFVKKCR